MTRPPAGFYPANLLVGHVVMAGCSIVCTACGHEGRLPFPKDASYSAVVDEYLERHRLCASAGTASDPRVNGPERGAA